MKILHVTHGFEASIQGGIEGYLHMTTAAQLAQGHEVGVLAGSLQMRPQCVVEQGELAGCSVWRLHRDDWYFDHYAHAYHPRAAAEIRALLRREQPQVVHLHQWIRLSCNIVEICTELGIPVVVTLHDVYTSCPRAFRVDRDGAACGRTLEAANCVPCVPRFSEESAAEQGLAVDLFRAQYLAELRLAARVLVAAPETIALLAAGTGLSVDLYTQMDLPYAPRFVDLDRGAPPARGCRFGCWGSLDRHKGVDFLITAFADACAEGMDAELLLFGPLPPEPRLVELRDLAEGLPLKFAGAFGPAELAAAGLQVGVFPSLCHETFGLALTECFELGLPALVSDLGALASRLDGAGMKLPPGDRAAWSAALQQMAADPGLRARHAAALPALPPDPRRHALALDAVYQEVRREPRAQLSGSPPAAERWAELLLLQRERWAATARGLQGRREPS